MSQNRFSSQSHENNGQGNGVLHEALPGTGTLPQELLRQAAKAEGERALNGPEEQAAAGPDAGGLGGERNKFRSTAEHTSAEEGRAAEDPASRAASAAGDAAPRSDGRSEDGRFYFGNRAGPGNPFGRQVALLKKTLLNMVTPQRLERMLEPILQLVEQGDKLALKFILPYLVGKPQTETHPDRLDFEEWNMLKESADWMADVNALLTRPSRWMPLGAVRVGQPAITQERAAQIHYVLSAKGKDKENVSRCLSDPEKGLEKISEAMRRQQTGSQQKKKQRRH